MNLSELQARIANIKGRLSANPGATNRFGAPLGDRLSGLEGRFGNRIDNLQGRLGSLQERAAGSPLFPGRLDQRIQALQGRISQFAPNGVGYTVPPELMPNDAGGTMSPPDPTGQFIENREIPIGRRPFLRNVVPLPRSGGANIAQGASLGGTSRGFDFFGPKGSTGGPYAY